jgi:two-component system cell cycle response regulator
MLAKEQTVDVEADPNEALFRAAEGNYDLIIVSLGLQNFDALRLCSQVRSLERTRNVPILAIAESEDNMRLMRGLEIGVNDYLMRPIDKNELLARVRTQVRRRRYTERLRDNMQMSIEAAITDALTGLHNRRYMESHLATLVEQAASRGKPLSLLVLDIACRLGGEEFVVVMPETDMAVAGMVAERLRRRIASEGFAIEHGARTVEVTISIGLAALAAGSDDAAAIIKRADQALYRAKRDGRNRVVADAA